MSQRTESGWGRRLTLLITNSIKIGGLAIAIEEVFSQAQPRALEIALAAFMMAGAQLSEEALLGIAAHMFGDSGSERPKGRKR